MPDVRFEAAVVRLAGFTFGPVSVSIEEGLTVVLGPSGAGKSTLIALAAGVRPATEGAVRIDGADLARLSDHHRAALRRGPIAFAPQQPLFLAHLDLFENLALAARLRATGCDRIEPLLARLGLGGKTHRRPAELSGGELSRANTARALLGPAGLVCLDEPTAMLDEECAESIRSLIREEAGHRRLLVATHDAALIAAARRRLRLENGSLAA